MESKIYMCNVYHSRINPIKHTFSYAVYYFLFDLDELESGKLDNSLFGYNKTRLISIKNTGYMGDENKTIKEKVINRLKLYKEKLINEYEKQQQQQEEQQEEVSETNKQTKFYNENILKLNVESIKSITLITNPRYFNYSFNPVSFYYCYNENKELVQIVVEINNTFGETHLYFPSPTEFNDSNLKYPFKNSIDNNSYLKRYSSSKDFHVSPFNSLDGAYDFYFSDITKNCFDIRINLMSSLKHYSLETLHQNQNQNQNDNKSLDLYDYIILTRLWSTKKPLSITVGDLSKLLINYPITAFKTVPRILYQAGKLHWEKNLKIYSKPNPPLENTTILIKPSKNQLTALDFFLNYLNQFNSISIILNLPDKNSITIDNRINNNTDEKQQQQQQQQPIQIYIKNYEFFWKLFIMNKTINSESRGFSSKAIGMAYMCNDFECNDLPNLITQLCDLSISTNCEVFDSTNNYYNKNNNNENNDENEKKRIWSDLSEFINMENILTLFLFNNNNNSIQQYLSSYTINDNEKIINDLNIIKNGNQNLLIIEPLLNLDNQNEFINYLIENQFMNNNNNNDDDNDDDDENSNKLTILIKSKELYEKYCDSNSIVLENSMISILNMNFDSFSRLSENKLKYDKIISMQNNNNNNNNNNSGGSDDYNLSLLKSLLKSNLSSKLLIQEIKLNNKFSSSSSTSIKKPIRKSSFKNSYYKVIDEATKKYWAVMANFQHNPFYLENRYLDLMKMLNNNYHINSNSSIINGHIFDENINNYHSNNNNNNNNNNNDDNNKNEENDNNNNNEIIKNIILNWIKQCNDNQSLFSIKIQESAMKQGCLLKMNINEINEIYRGVIFHLSYLYASFNSSAFYFSNKIYSKNQ
ncbi:hypothetical protein ACTFIW_004395 [Dictyostelium discoideum]